MGGPQGRLDGDSPANPRRPRQPEGDRAWQGRLTPQADRPVGARSNRRASRPQGPPVPPREGQSALGRRPLALPRHRPGVGGVTPHYLRIVPGDPLPDLAGYAPFSAVVILSSEYPTDWRTEVNRWL